MTTAGIVALMLLLAGAAGALGRLAHHLNQERRDQQQIEQRQKGLNALPKVTLPRVVPPTGTNHTKGQPAHLHDWADWDL